MIAYGSQRWQDEIISHLTHLALITYPKLPVIIDLLKHSLVMNYNLANDVNVWMRVHHKSGGSMACVSITVHTDPRDTPQAVAEAIFAETIKWAKENESAIESLKPQAPPPVFTIHNGNGGTQYYLNGVGWWLTRKECDEAMGQIHDNHVADGHEPIWYIVHYGDEPVDKIAIGDGEHEGFPPRKIESIINSFYDNATDDEKKLILDINN